MGAISALALWPVFLCLAGGQGYYDDYGGRMSRKEEEERCGRGHFDYRIDECICDEGWKVAGLTDFFNFLKGKCTQFQCSSDHQCQERLGDHASCPVEGWNCYCGWEKAFEGTGPLYFGLSSGYETRSAACMGPLYTLSFWATGYTVWLCSELWKLIFFFMLVMVFFGQTHVRCQCHDPSMFRLLNKIFCYPSQCDGTCTIPGNRLRDTLWTLYYDLAWSIYVLDVGIWLYCFLVVLLGTFLVGWTILIWLIVIAALVCTAIAMLIGAICGAGGGDAGGDACCNNCDCNNCNCDLNVGDCRCDGCCPGNASGGGLMPDLYFYGYTGGPSSDGDCCDCNCCGSLGRCCLFYPLARLFQLFPRMPSNMWGGLFGYFCLKTHPWRGGAVYQGGSRFTDFFGFRGNDSLNVRRDDDWRNRVARYLGVREARQAAPSQLQMISNGPTTRPQGAALDRRPSSRPSGVRLIKGRRVVSSDSPFDPESDNCKNSTFEDYKSRHCWICCDSESEPNWDLWVQCGHLFCSRCSEQMLERGMPCPLCRRVSYTVKRGQPFHEYTPPDAPA